MNHLAVFIPAKWLKRLFFFEYSQVKMLLLTSVLSFSLFHFIYTDHLTVFLHLHSFILPLILFWRAGQEEIGVMNLGCLCWASCGPSGTVRSFIFRTLSEGNTAQWVKGECKLTTNYAPVNKERLEEGTQYGSLLAFILTLRAADRQGLKGGGGVSREKEKKRVMVNQG